MIIKSRSIVQVWNVFNSPAGITGDTVLDLSENYGSNTGGNIEIVANASTFGIGSATQVNTSLATFIAYCFHSVEGYSKVGRYSGNNNADGPFIYTGFKPAWVMCKSYGTGGTHYDWPIYDSTRSPYNEIQAVLEANQNQAEIVDGGRGLPIDFTSNGFKHRSSYAENNSNTTYIYIAFAESPFKYSNAR